ncbi:MAG: DoxX family protein [Acidimicrobiia bacterium]|nr:DoxX family protein [Acidimicrobiia bacterium]
MNRLLWVLQVVFGVYFIAVGVVHFLVPEGLPGPMEWMYELSDPLHIVAGVAEILGGMGLILPGLTGVHPHLTVLAAAGLVIMMLGAAVWHLSRGEAANIALNLVNAAVLGFIAYGRWRLSPLDGRQSVADPRAGVAPR